MSKQETPLAPNDIDIRLAIGVPHDHQPLKMTCPTRIHQARIGQPDDKGSLAVYESNLHCYGCGWHTSRRYASLAFLLGLWDGVGSENSERVAAAVRKLKPRLPEFKRDTVKKEPKKFVPPLDPYAAEAFHQYLLRYAREQLEELETRRGLSYATIRQFRLGYSGTHFTIPLYDLSGDLYSVRFRADERVVDTDDPNYRKYDGTFGRNQPILYPLQILRGVAHVEELWLVEGEYDALANIQAGNYTLTVTNGANNVARILDLIAGELPWLEVGRWVVAVDQDGAGEMAAEKIMSVLSSQLQPSVRARWSHGKDLGEFYSAGGRRGDIWYEDHISYSRLGREDERSASRLA